MQKKSDGEEKYDPLEADAAESEEDDSQQDVKPTKEEPEVITIEASSDTQETKKTPNEETWTDADNDNNAETNNVTDNVEKEQEKPQTKIEQNHSPQMMKTSTPRGRGFMRGRGNQRARKSRR